MTGASAGTVITGTLIMAALAYKSLDLVKYLWVLVRLHFVEKPPRGKNRQERKDWKNGADGKDWRNGASSAWNGLVTLLLGCVAGIGVVFLMAHTTWSTEIRLGTHTLKTLPSSSLVVAGLAVTSIAALLFDAKKAVDNNDSASTPKLMPRADENRRASLRASQGPSDASFADHE